MIIFMKRSLHILADLFDCRGENKYFNDKGAVRQKMLRVVKKAGFKIVASRFHKFAGAARSALIGSGRGAPNKIEEPDEGGITGVIIVSESHIMIHTWPERRFVNIDVFFCNYTQDNSKKARGVFRFLKTLYRPKKIRRKEVWRD